MCIVWIICKNNGINQTKTKHLFQCLLFFVLLEIVGWLCFSNKSKLQTFSNICFAISNIQLYPNFEFEFETCAGFLNFKFKVCTGFWDFKVELKTRYFIYPY